MSSLRVRRESVPDSAMVAVRGGLLDPASLRRDALVTVDRFGVYGVSVLAFADEAALDHLARRQLRGYRQLTVASAAAIRAVGLDLQPTFRRPHYTVIFEDLDRDIARLCACENEVRPNPHHETPSRA